MHLRRNVLSMAAHGYGPVSFWLDMPLIRLQPWIKEHNKLVKERDEKE